MTKYADQRGHDVAWMTAEERNALDEQIRSALEGDSNDAEHDALVAVADMLGISWDLS